MAVEFHDHSMEVKAAIEAAAISYLHEAAGELESQVKRNTRVGTGQLKSSWSNVVDTSNLVATIGSPLQNAIWEEFGTGEHAMKGNGRKGGWFYKDDSGWHHTYGKTPSRAFQTAYNSLKPALIRRAEQVLGGID